LKKKNIIKLTLLLSAMMTMMAGAVVAPSLPQITDNFRDIPNYELLTKLIITLPAIFIAFFSPIYGMLADKYGRKQFLIFALILYAISGTSGYYFNDLYLILFGRAILGIAVAGIMTISVTLVGDYFKGEERNSFMGTQGAFMGVGGFVFISLAGFLADIHWQAPFLIYLFSVLVLILVIIIIHPPEVHKRREHKQINISYNKKQIYGIYLIMFTSIVFFYIVPVQVPYLLQKNLDISNAVVGLSISSFTLTGAIVSVNYKRIKRNFKFIQLFQISYFAMGSGYIMMSIQGNYSIYIIGLILAGMGSGLMMPSGNLWVMSIAPDIIRGKLMGFASTATFLGMFMSPIILQPVVSATNLDLTFRIAGITLYILSLAFFINQKR
jgi:MFS family permease